MAPAPLAVPDRISPCFKALSSHDEVEPDMHRNAHESWVAAWVTSDSSR